MWKLLSGLFFLDALSYLASFSVTFLSGKVSIFWLQEKLFSSKNRTEASLGKKLKFDVLPEVEKAHKVLYTF